jgi:hypothetical protein
MQPCDREGTFKAQIESYGLKEMETGSVAVAIRANLLECWSGEGWDAWSEYQMDATGDLWIVKKDGTLNSSQVEALIKCAGWDGNLESITNETWKPTPCQVVVQRDDYKGQTRFRIAFINDIDRTPGAFGNVDAGKAKELQARHGAALRALAGNAKRNGAPAPTGKPATPPPAAPRPAPKVDPGFEPIPH